MVHIFWIPVRVTREPDEGSIPGSPDGQEHLNGRECHYLNFY